MRVLIGCEKSGVVRRAFRDAGHDAWSCDIVPAEDSSPFHITADVQTVLSDGWDMLIAHPECKYLCGSGIHWNNRGRGWEQTEKALQFALSLARAPIPRIAIENPVGILSTRWRKPDQIIHPWMFGHDASKTTCLWLQNLPPLFPTRRIYGRLVNGRERFANQTDSGQNRLGPSPTRSAERAETYAGIAEAMAKQWS